MREHPLFELTLRKYEKPYDKSKRELCRKICLSLGLLQPGDSRDIIVYVLNALAELRKPAGISELTELILKLRKSEKLDPKGAAPSNIRRQLRRLRELDLLRVEKNKYSLTESLTSSFEEKIEGYLLKSITKRIKEYLEELDKYEN